MMLREPIATRPVVATSQFAHVVGPAVITTSMWSTALKRRVQVTAYLPPGFRFTAGPYPVLYLLHGLPGDAPSTVKALDLEATLDRLITLRAIEPMIVVAPSDGPTPSTDTEWTNSPIQPSSKWGTFVVSDLVSWSQRELPVCATRSGRAIGGLSMGAFGATNLALHHLSEFGSATLWSSYFLGNTPAIEGPEGSPGWWNDSPLRYLPSMISALRREPLRLSFYSSPTDSFYPENVEFAKLLTAEKIPFRFSSYRGGHDMAVWRSELASEITWLSKDFSC